MRAARPSVRCLAGLAIVASGLGGCTRAIDRDEAAACRIAAAGRAAPIRLAVGGQTPLSADRDGRPGVRLTLSPEDPDLRLAWLECRFLRSGPGPEIASLATPSGPVDDTHLYILKRFWMGSEDAAAADPGIEAAREAGLPTLPFEAAYLLQQLIDVMPNAAIYGLLAAAYSLVYGLHGRINLAFGEITAVGGLGAVIGAAALRDAPTGALLGGALAWALWAAGLHGLVVERLVMRPLSRTTGQVGLVATVGVALVLREELRLATGARPQWIAPLLSEPTRLARAGDFVVTVTPMALVVGVGAAAAAAGLLAMFRFTDIGRDWRAAADDPLAASLVGVDPHRLSRRTYGIAAALMGAAGAGAALHLGGIGVEYTTGLGLKALIAAILGGIGSVPGAFLGGIAIAAAEGLWSAYFPIEDRDLMVFVLLVATLVVRPGGLFGDRDPQAARIGLRRG